MVVREIFKIGEGRTSGPAVPYLWGMATTQTRIDPDIEELLDSIAEAQASRKLVLFNDDQHDMLEVIVQVIRARSAAGVPCTPEEAKAIMLETHSTGQGIVLEGTLEVLKKAQVVLEAIDLRTDIVD